MMDDDDDDDDDEFLQPGQRQTESGQVQECSGKFPGKVWTEP